MHLLRVASPKLPEIPSLFAVRTSDLALPKLADGVDILGVVGVEGVADNDCFRTVMNEHTEFL